MTTVKASLTTILIFMTIGLIVCLPGADAMRLGQWQGAVFILAGGGIAIAPICRYFISWDDRALVYRGLISTRTIKFSEVERFDVHGPALSNRFGPTLGLRLFSKSSIEPVMTINLKPFTRRDITRLVETLKEKTG